MKLSKNFDTKEFACPCCDGVMVDNGLVSKLQILRDLIDLPINISSGYRCRRENKKVGGYPDSPHIDGIAADIIVSDFDYGELALLALEAGFYRVGLYPFSNSKFLHLDIKPPSPSQAWIRWKNGKYTYYKTLRLALDAIDA